MKCPFCKEELQLGIEIYFCNNDKFIYHDVSFNTITKDIHLAFLSENKEIEYEFEYLSDKKLVSLFVYSNNPVTSFLSLNFGEINSLDEFYTKTKSYVKNIAFQ